MCSDDGLSLLHVYGSSVAIAQLVRHAGLQYAMDAIDRFEPHIRSTVSVCGRSSVLLCLWVFQRRHRCPARSVSHSTCVYAQCSISLDDSPRLFDTGNYAGVDAFTITADEELGEYGEPVFHVRLGQVPDHEGE